MALVRMEAFRDFGVEHNEQGHPYGWPCSKFLAFPCYTAEIPCSLA